MTAPRPLTEADRAMLTDVIAKRWPACCAEGDTGPGVWLRLADDGTLDAGHPIARDGTGWAPARGPAALRALAILADDLEHDPNLCLDIAREPRQPPRVLGWATASVTLWQTVETVRIVDLDIRHPARVERDERIHRERMARRSRT